MAYRNNRNFDRNNYGGSISRNVDPWDNSGEWGMRHNMGGGGGLGGGNNNNGGGMGGGFNQNSNNELANHLLQLLRNQGGGGGGNQGGPPSLMDLPQGDMRGYGGGGYGGGRNNNMGGGGGGGDFDRFDNRRMGGGVMHHNNNGGGNNRQNHANHNGNMNNRNVPNRRGMGGVGGGAGPNMRGPQQQSHPMPQHKGGNQNNQRNSGGIRKPNPVDRTKKVLAKNAQNNKNNNKAAGEAKNNKKAAAAAAAAADQSFADENEDNENATCNGESAYADVPADMFFCHLCKKHMWDSTSFENHIKGRTHQMMKEGVEESYRLKANMIRQEAKIDEQLKSIEVDRLKRMGKQMKNANAHREYCQMCDLHFYGHLSTHRKSDGHLMLKKFLHPKCPECNEEFQNRIEFDAHLLSREHMLKCAAKASRMDQRKKNQLVILTEAEENKDVREEKQKPAAAAAAAPAEKPAEGEEGAAAPTENGEAAPAADGEAAATGEEKPAEDGAEAKTEETQPEENPDVILDYIEGSTEVGVDVENKIPVYKSTRALATSMIAKLECFECKLCNRYFDNETTAEIHSRTVYHHKQFSKFLTEKSNEAKIAQKRAAATVENEKRKRARAEKEAAGEEASESPVVTEVNPDVSMANGEALEAEVKAEDEVKEEQAEEDNGEQPEKKAKVEMYDPCEATPDTDEKDAKLNESITEATPIVADPPPPATPTQVAAPTPVKSAPATPVAPAKSAPATPATPASANKGLPNNTPSPSPLHTRSGTPMRGRGGNQNNRGTPRGRGRPKRF